MSERDTAENDATEYRVMWWHEAHAAWYSHAGTTDKRQVADAWLEQAAFRNGGTDAVLQSRIVAPWTRVIPPGADHE